MFSYVQLQFQNRKNTTHFSLNNRRIFSSLYFPVPTLLSHKKIQGILAWKMNTNRHIDLAQTANRQIEVNNTSWVIQLKVNWHSSVELVANATFHRIPTSHKDSKSLTILGFQEKYDGNSVIQTLLYLIYLPEFSHFSRTSRTVGSMKISPIRSQ
jgi:hypothetical protein